MTGPTPCHFTCRADHSAELFIVEGKHAANAVNRVRNKNDQAVLAMQGKVPNVVRLGLGPRVENNIQVRNLAAVLGVQSNGLPGKDYKRVVLLCDPDADGLHAVMLLICLFAEAYPALVRDGVLYLCRCPLYLIKNAKCGEDKIAYSDAELLHLRNHYGAGQTQRFKGVASLPAELLHRVCVDPSTRAIRAISEAECTLSLIHI